MTTSDQRRELPPVQIKQWVSIPGGSIALRSGAGVLSNFGTELRTQWEDLIAVLFLSAIRQMKTLLSFCVETSTTIGFLVTRVDVRWQAATAVATEAQVLSALAKCTDSWSVGHEGVISLANHVANKWCRGEFPAATVPRLI